MAKLSSGNLSLEIRYAGLGVENWIEYDILFLYKGESMIQDSQLKRVNKHWQKRSPGAFFANEFDYDRLIGTILDALETDEPQYYEPTDPDFILAIYPQMRFPFLPSKWILIGESEEAKQDREDYELVREIAGGRLPSDVFTLILQVDIYNYGEERAYQGNGPALIISTTRDQLRLFAEALATEYSEFCKKWDLPERPETSDSDDWDWDNPPSIEDLLS